jgi:hypothetical protein
MVRRPKQGKAKGPEPVRERGPEERARNLLLRLEADGVNPVQAAEELDRLQGALERAGKLQVLTEALQQLCDAWAEGNLRGDRGRAWLVLVGAFGFAEHVGRVGEIAWDSGLTPALRIPALRALARFKGEEAVRVLQAVLLSRSDAQVRATAAEGLADIGDRSVRPVLEELLEEELPRNVWNAVNGAVDRLR